MKNKIIEELYHSLSLELKTLPESKDKEVCLASLQSSLDAAKLADEDCRYNPPGKVVIRNKDGKVVGVQG